MYKPKTFHSIWVHIVFRTKNSKPYLSWEIRNEVCKFIKMKGNERGILIDTVNGVKDHLHVLLRINTTQTVAECVNWIKGASSRWLDLQYNWKDGFAWQEGYGVFSVSFHDVKTVRDYIYKQEQHHRNNICINNFEKMQFKYTKRDTEDIHD